ncbi:DUF4136 domain-containing protein [Fulvivirgaceae bacterium BMA10]|uniref:DUF4136 domain-containing protein n=1 Tax=Splendidivirga corallicola TaxID=3051826 RepID=A0ABT8KUD2_9BACT|nr:DUF4136 domain-containing protein [Fulvivirgaceae bacterium BMA10]
MFVTACTSTGKVVTHFDEGVDFGAYATFVLQTNEKFSPRKVEEKDKIENAIVHEMEQRAYKLSYNDPDLEVSYRLILETKNEYRQNYQTNPYNYRYYYYDDTRVRRYSEGILLIEVRDISKRKLIWHGSLNLSFNRGRKSTYKDIDALISLIYDNYPQKPNQLVEK